jgi:hypothetical protein
MWFLESLTVLENKFFKIKQINYFKICVKSIITKKENKVNKTIGLTYWILWYNPLMKNHEQVRMHELSELPVACRRAVANDLFTASDIILEAYPKGLGKGKIASRVDELRADTHNHLIRNEATGLPYSFLAYIGNMPAGYVQMGPKLEANGKAVVIIDGWFTRKKYRSLKLMRSMIDTLFSMRKEGLQYEYNLLADKESSYPLILNERIQFYLRSRGFSIEETETEEKAKKRGYQRMKIKQIR